MVETLRARVVKRALREVATAKRKKTNEWFFKTGKGQYGVHDCFIGVAVPQSHAIAVEYKDMLLQELTVLLASNVHEDRLCALHILVLQMKKAVKESDQKTQKAIYQFYLAHTSQVNNWDLVDCSAHYIVGQHILDHPKDASILYELVMSKNMWDRRIAMVSQWLMIRERNYHHVLPLAKILLKDKEDLMHKAVGWMLREMWKRESVKVEFFIIKNYEKIPRTTVRYAIERMDEQKRKKFLKGTF